LIDDILGIGNGDTDQPRDAGPATTGPSAPELQRWPGEHVFSEDDGGEVEPFEQEATAEAEEAPSQMLPEADEPALEPRAYDTGDKPYLAPDRPAEEKDGFVDISNRNAGVDVESATSDKNIDLDQPLRKMGWDDYGERLKKKNETRKKKKD
jgi:hypothetical protein